MKLSNLGFDPWFEAHAPQFLEDDGGIARISAVDRGSYLIRNESGEVPAELAGKLSYQIESSADLPCVGDWVAAHYYNDDTAAIIHRVFPRKTFLRRRVKPAACARTFLCRARAVTPRFTRGISVLLYA